LGATGDAATHDDGGFFEVVGGGESVSSGNGNGSGSFRSTTGAGAPATRPPARDWAGT